MAREVVAARGFRDAQITAIALTAGVAIGTIYRYFPSRAELFAEVIGATSKLEIETISRIAGSEGPAVQRLADAVCAFARRALQSRRLAYALVGEPVDAEIDVARLEYRRALGDVFARILREGITSGEFPAQEVEASTACLVGALIEGLVGPLAPSSVTVDDRESLVEAIALFCLRAVSGKDE